nr:outer fiber protein [Avian orthoreovirus]
MDKLTPVQRREVVALILSLAPSVSTSPGDLTPIYDRLNALDVQVKSLNVNVSDLHTSVSEIASDLQSAITSLGDLTSQLVDLRISHDNLSRDVSSLTLKLSTVDSSVQSLSAIVSSHSDTLTTLSSDVTNVQNDISSINLSITDLTTRVSKLEAAEGADLTFNMPLKVENGAVSLLMDPDFCSNNQQLSSYSAAAQFLDFQWLVYIRSNGSQDAVTTTVNAHCHGTRSDFIVVSTSSVTVTGSAVTVSFDLDKIVNPPADLAKLVPTAAFQAARFPVEVTYTRGSSTSAVIAYGTFTTARKWDVTIQTAGTGAANLTYLMLRYGLDT